MAEVQRWSVTYTKHLKQKRKVYHDGFLLLHSSINKVMLYDESESLLECRILKAEEAVRSGESLTFNAYLIDVGDPEGQPMPSGASKKSSIRRKEFTSPSISSAGVASTTEKNRAGNISLSPSHKIIREFKKREMHKYGNLQQSASSAEPTGGTEWEVLYTTQLIQKAKKYHDGFLRCPTSGPMFRQVILYDESWKLLESRFLKKGEEARSGQTMEFHGHLVEIGERKLKNETLPATNAKGRSCSSFPKLEMPKQQGDTNVGRTIDKEWQVLYTKQVSQKAKKYHDGFLQLVTCGSLGRQVMLYDASRKLLESKFLKKDEMISSGASMAFDAHLVDVGELQVLEEAVPNSNVQGTFSGGIGETRIGGGNLNCTKVNESSTRVHSFEKAGSVRGASTSNGSYSSEKQKSSGGISKDGPVRDASGILSFLQKPANREVSAAESANMSVVVTLESPTKRTRGSDRLQGAIGTEAGSTRQSGTEKAGINDLVSLGGFKAETVCNENELDQGRAMDERNPEEAKSAANADNEWPSFDLGF